MKPICVMYFPVDFTFHPSGMKIDLVDLMSEFNGWPSNSSKREQRDVGDSFGGYMYWCFHKENITEPELQVFHPKNFTKIQYKELKELLLNKLKEMNDVPTTAK